MNRRVRTIEQILCGKSSQGYNDDLDSDPKLQQQVKIEDFINTYLFSEMSKIIKNPFGNKSPC